MRVLHLSADYPDPLQPAKTRAIANLLPLAAEHEHRVYSLNRVGWRAGVSGLDFDDAAGEGHRAVAYGAPPKGLFLARRLARLSDWIAEDLARSGWRPDVVHAHKLSVEALAAAPLARAFGAPLLLSLQGDSDLKIIGARRDMRGVYARIWHKAAVALPFAPWTETRISALLGPREGPVLLLPCPPGEDVPVRAPKIVDPVFLSAFHFGSARRKNADNLIRAIGAGGGEMRLNIAGGGAPEAFAALDGLARTAAPGRVRFLGAVAHAAMPDHMNAACAFAMPSRRESFGMVFTEALRAGAPCLLPSGWGLDGYLPDGVATVSVPAGDVEAIADALARLAREQKDFKARLARLGETGGLDQFTRRRIGSVYGEALAQAATTRDAQ